MIQVIYHTFLWVFTISKQFFFCSVSVEAWHNFLPFPIISFCYKKSEWILIKESHHHSIRKDTDFIKLLMKKRMSNKILDFADHWILFLLYIFSIYVYEMHFLNIFFIKNF